MSNYVLSPRWGTPVGRSKPLNISSGPTSICAVQTVSNRPETTEQDRLNLSLCSQQYAEARAVIRTNSGVDTDIEHLRTNLVVIGERRA